MAPTVLDIESGPDPKRGTRGSCQPPLCPSPPFGHIDLSHPQGLPPPSGLTRRPIPCPTLPHQAPVIPQSSAKTTLPPLRQHNQHIHNYFVCSFCLNRSSCLMTGTVLPQQGIPSVGRNASLCEHLPVQDTVLGTGREYDRAHHVAPATWPARACSGPSTSLPVRQQSLFSSVCHAEPLHARPQAGDADHPVRPSLRVGPSSTKARQISKAMIKTTKAPRIAGSGRAPAASLIFTRALSKRPCWGALVLSERTRRLSEVKGPIQGHTARKR